MSLLEHRHSLTISEAFLVDSIMTITSSAFDIGHQHCTFRGRLYRWYGKPDKTRLVSCQANFTDLSSFNLTVKRLLSFNM